MRSCPQVRNFSITTAISSAPNAKLRALVGPQEPEAPAHEAKPAETDAGCAHHRPVRLSWAKLLKRVFDLDLEHCPNCGSELKIIAAILEQPVIEKILMHLGLQADCGRRSAPARDPRPEERFALASANAACKAGHPLWRQPVAKRCKRPDDSESSPFRWPAEQGYGDRQP